MWIDVKGYEGLYQINENGQVKSLPRVVGKTYRKGRILKTDKSNSGYLRVTLCKDSITKRVLLHRFVYENFIGEIPKSYCINHIDHNRENNNITNLEAISIMENNRRKTNTKLTETKVKAIRQSNLNSKQLSVLYNISPRTVLHIKKNDRWENI